MDNTHAAPGMSRQVRQNAVALISLALAIASLAYTTWRNESSEAHRNIRQAAFKTLEVLEELQVIVDARRYQDDRMRGDYVTGWARVGLIGDLGSVMPAPMPDASSNLRKTWQENFDAWYTNDDAEAEKRISGCDRADPEEHAADSPDVEMNVAMRRMLITLALGLTMSAHPADPADSTMPAFTHTKAADWLNSPPLTWKDLRGDVVLLEFWTFACSNCRGSVPWVRSLQEKYASRGLRVIGVHTPELPQEYERERVVAKVAEYRLANPQMIDNDYSYWNAMSNQYWPAFYLVDKNGLLRAEYFGETHPGDRQAAVIESSIERLLGER